MTSTFSFKLQESKDFITSDTNIKSFSTFKYLSLITGYTSRLLTSDIDLEGFLDHYNTTKQTNIQILLIYDNLWGKGLYFDPAKSEEVKEFNKLTEIRNGSVVFYSPDEELSFLSWLKFTKEFVGDEDMQYCVNSGIDGIEEKDIVLSIRYETESG